MARGSRRVGSIWMLYGRSNEPRTDTNPPEGVTAVNGSSFRSREMAQNVKNGSIWIDYEEATNAPWLVSERIDDLKVAFNGTFVQLIDVCHLDAHVRQQR